SGCERQSDTDLRNGEFTVPNKKQEEFCRHEFHGWLKHHLRAIPYWNPGDDPPDFRLTLNGVKYAVEVTRIVCQDSRTVWASLRRLVKQVSEQARHAGNLVLCTISKLHQRDATMSC